MVKDTFFTQTTCDRCGGSLAVRKLSWFTSETICMECIKAEDKIKQLITDSGQDLRDFEGCGHVPTEDDFISEPIDPEKYEDN